MDDLDLGATIKGFIAGQKVFNRYVLVRQLGRGGMGVVWLARDESLEREVAIKMLPEIVANDPVAVKELKRETAKSQRLSHPRILRIYDFVETGPLCGITMEYVEGGTLAAKRLEQPGEVFSPVALSKWVRQLCEALAYAHGEVQIVHRDLKPANLMIDRAGDLKVADFGIAASVSDSVSRVSQQAGSSGTPVYMSPQQMMGEKPAVTDDLYALGATLYELLTGKPPFYSGNIIMQVQNKVPPSLAARRADLGVTGEIIPPEWEETIAACLAKEPSDRPQSAGEVAERLDLTTKGTKDTKTGGEQKSSENRAKPLADSSGQSKIPTQKSKTPALAGLIAAGVIVLGIAGWYFGLHAPEQRRIEQAKMESERQQAEAIRMAAEREAETRRIEAARFAAEQEAERQRVAAEQARLSAARGGLIVRTTPAGAEVRVGAVALDKSPLNLKDQRLGKYPVRIRLAGYEDWDGEVEVKENEFSELNVPLVRSTGAVTLTSEPAGLDYTIKGEVTRTGRTPAELSLPTGRYDLTFQRAGWPEQARTVEVRRNEAAAATAEFVPGSLELTSSPSGAEVWSGGRQVGTTPYRVPEALPGRYDYELRLVRHKPATAAVTVNPRQQARESVRLEEQPYPVPGQPHENSLGMKFVPVPGTNVLFSIWETRVQDFEAFVKETGYDATAGMYSDRGDGLRQQGDSWKSPGFPQGPTHPVVGVNQVDAQAFCRWLTERERRAGRLAPDQEYRLPNDAEWDAAVGKEEFPWGSQWPPPRGAGNYADEAAKRGRYSNWPIPRGYDDGYDATAPVGSFTPNRFGLYDLGGNVLERVGDRQHGLRGASFAHHVLRGGLASSGRFTEDTRLFYIGFRVVCAVGSAAQQPAQATVDLEMIAARLIPSGTAIIGGRPVLLFGSRRIYIGDTIQINFEGADYAFEVTEIGRSTFKVTSEGESFVRPIQPGTL